MEVVISNGKRVGKDGFILECGRAKIPVSVVDYSSETQEDLAYEGRVCVVEAFTGFSVPLFKRLGSYIDEESGEVKNYVNFYLRFGTDLIGIKVFYSPMGTDKKDVNYGVHKRILSAFAEVLPERVGTKKERGKAIVEDSNETPPIESDCAPEQFVDESE